MKAQSIVEQCVFLWSPHQLEHSLSGTHHLQTQYVRRNSKGSHVCGWRMEWGIVGLAAESAAAGRLVRALAASSGHAALTVVAQHRGAAALGQEPRLICCL